jgi:hypothetical protein
VTAVAVTVVAVAEVVVTLLSITVNATAANALLQRVISLSEMTRHYGHTSVLLSVEIPVARRDESPEKAQAVTILSSLSKTWTHSPEYCMGNNKGHSLTIIYVH